MRLSRRNSSVRPFCQALRVLNGRFLRRRAIVREGSASFAASDDSFERGDAPATMDCELEQ